MSDSPTALAIRPNVLPTPAQFDMMRFMAERLAYAEGFLPKHFFAGDPRTRPHRVLAAIEYGRAVGIEPMIALQNITMIDGKAGASALLIGAQLRRAGYQIKTSWYDQQGVTVPKESPQVWGCKVVLAKGGADTGEGVFSLTDAQRAGLIRDGSGWQKYPKDMVYARALTQAAREGAQDAVLGMQYTAEELGADVDYDGQAVSVPANGPAALEGEVVPDVAPGVSEATAVSPPSDAAIQPTPPAPSVEAQTEPTIPGGEATQTSQGSATGSGGTSGSAIGADSGSAPPPTVNVAPLSGPALARRMGAGRSIGPAPKRTNVVTVEQGPTAPAMASEMARQAPVPDGPGEPALAPPGLTDEPIDDGLAPQRELLRVAAAELAHVNAILRNQMEHALKNEPLEVVPPATPSRLSDEGLARLIDRDYPGRTLANLDGEAIQNRLELVESNLAKKKTLMLERGITEE